MKRAGSGSTELLTAFIEIPSPNLMTHAGPHHSHTVATQIYI